MMPMRVALYGFIQRPLGKLLEHRAIRAALPFRVGIAFEDRVLELLFEPVEFCFG